MADTTTTTPATPTTPSTVEIDDHDDNHYIDGEDDTSNNNTPTTPTTPTPTSPFHEGSLQEGVMQVKDCKGFFAKWRKFYVVLTKEQLILKSKRDDATPAEAYNVTEINFQEYSGAGKECCIKIHSTKKNKSFFIAAFSFMQFNAWKKAFLKLNVLELPPISKSKGIFISPLQAVTSVSTARSRLEVVEPEKWSVSDVQEWLSYVRAADGTKMVDQFGDQFGENDVDGKTLLQMDDSALKAVGVKSLGKRVKLLHEIEKLKQQKRYSLNEHLVMSKFEKMDPRFLKEISNLEQRVQALCDREQIKKTYLNPAQLESSELKREMEDERDGDADGFSLIEEEEAKEYEELKIRVKLIVTEITHSDSHKSLRKILSRVAGRLSITEFGLFHTALIVGPWYLEWNDSSLCIPKKICSSMALISADIDNIMLAKDDIHTLSDKLSEVVVDWNVNRDYVNYKVNKKPHEGNCQEFVEAVLEKLELKPMFTGALGNYLKDMKLKGQCEMAFRPDEAFIKAFKLDEPTTAATSNNNNNGTYTFDTHAELDMFVERLKKVSSTLQLDFPSEYGLLKSFDRAFWLRHIKDPKDDKWKPLYITAPVNKAAARSSPTGGGSGGASSSPSSPAVEERTVLACPFNDPRITMSFR